VLVCFTSAVSFQHCVCASSTSLLARETPASVKRLSTRNTSSLWITGRACLRIDSLSSPYKFRNSASSPSVIVTTRRACPRVSHWLSRVLYPGTGPTTLWRRDTSLVLGSNYLLT